MAAICIIIIINVCMIYIYGSNIYIYKEDEFEVMPGAMEFMLSGVELQVFLNFLNYLNLYSFKK